MACNFKPVLTKGCVQFLGSCCEKLMDTQSRARSMSARNWKSTYVPPKRTSMSQPRAQVPWTTNTIVKKEASRPMANTTKDSAALSSDQKMLSVESRNGPLAAFFLNRKLNKPFTNNKIYAPRSFPSNASVNVSLSSSSESSFRRHNERLRSNQKPRQVKSQVRSFGTDAGYGSNIGGLNSFELPRNQQIVLNDEIPEEALHVAATMTDELMPFNRQIKLLLSAASKPHERSPSLTKYNYPELSTAPKFRARSSSITKYKYPVSDRPDELQRLRHRQQFQELSTVPKLRERSITKYNYPVIDRKHELERLSHRYHFQELSTAPKLRERSPSITKYKYPVIDRPDEFQRLSHQQQFQQLAAHRNVASAGGKDNTSGSDGFSFDGGVGVGGRVGEVYNFFKPKSSHRSRSIVSAHIARKLIPASVKVDKELEKTIIASAKLSKSTQPAALSTVSRTQMKNSRADMVANAFRKLRSSDQEELAETKRPSALDERKDKFERITSEGAGAHNREKTAPKPKPEEVAVVSKSRENAIKVLSAASIVESKAVDASTMTERVRMGGLGSPSQVFRNTSQLEPEILVSNRVPRSGKDSPTATLAKAEKREKTPPKPKDAAVVSKSWENAKKVLSAASIVESKAVDASIMTERVRMGGLGSPSQVFRNTSQLEPEILVSNRVPRSGKDSPTATLAKAEKREKTPPMPKDAAVVSKSWENAKKVLSAASIVESKAVDASTMTERVRMGGLGSPSQVFRNTSQLEPEIVVSNRVSRSGKDSPTATLAKAQNDKPQNRSIYARPKFF